MRVLSWAIRLVLFLLLVGLAAKNVEPVTLRFYFDKATQVPLVVALFGAFAVGALFGILALVGTLLRQRREIAALESQRRAAPEPVAPPTVPPI